MEMENVLRLTIDLKTRKMIDKWERLAQRIVRWLIVAPILYRPYTAQRTACMSLSLTLSL